MNAQNTYDSIISIDERIKELIEEKQEIQQDFFNKYQDHDLPIVDKTGRPKFFRVYEPEGRFVYNLKYETGVRAAAKKEWHEQNDKFDYKTECKDCSMLVEKDNEWFCDEIGKKCSDIIECSYNRV